MGEAQDERKTLPIRAQNGLPGEGDAHTEPKHKWSCPQGDTVEKGILDRGSSLGKDRNA